MCSLEYFLCARTTTLLSDKYCSAIFKFKQVNALILIVCFYVQLEVLAGIAVTIAFTLVFSFLL